MIRFGIAEEDYDGNLFINTETSNLNDLSQEVNIYYTKKETYCNSDVFIPFEENTEADWKPYNCIFKEYDIYYLDGKYYYDQEPEGAKCGTRISEYKEGELLKQCFIEDDYTY